MSDLGNNTIMRTLYKVAIMQQIMHVEAMLAEGPRV